MTILATLLWSFCNLLIAFMHLTSHTGQPYLMYGSAKLQYMFCKVAIGRYFFEKRNILISLDIFLVTAESCSSQLKCLSTIVNNNPKTFNIFYNGNIFSHL